MSAKIQSKSDAKPARPGKDTIYIDADEEITAIIDKVENAKQKVVALVLPKRAAMLQSIVNMRLLKRSSESAGKSVVLITSEGALMPLAGAAGIHVAKNLTSKPEIPPSPHAGAAGAADAEAQEVPEEDAPEKIDYNRSVGELATAGAGAEDAEAIALDDEDAADEPAKAAKAPKNKKLAVPNFDRFRLLLFGGIAAFIALIIFIILALTVLPRAKITITTASSPIAANFDLTTSDKAQALDMEKSVIPAVLKTQDQTASQQVQATGQKNLGDKSTGSVNMTTQRCAPNLGDTPGDVPAGTGISTNGLNFITQERTSFQFAGGSGSCVNYKANGIDVTAQLAGAKYNVNGATFTVTSRSDVSASGSASGGTDNIVTVVSQSDVDAVKNKLTSNKDSDNIQKQFLAQLSDQGYYVISQTLKASDAQVTASPDVGQQASTSNVSVKITFSVLAVGKKELREAVRSKLEKQIDKSKQKISDGDLLDHLTVSLSNQSSPSVASLSISKSTTAVPIIDVAAIKNQSGGKKSNEIKSLIKAYPGVKDVEVKMSPFWVSKAPKKPGKISVVMKQAKDQTPADSASD
jgi:hypothetical protein